MQKFNKIMLVIDINQEQKSAINRVITLAENSSIEVLLFACLHYPAVDVSPILNQQQYDDIKRAMLSLNERRLDQIAQEHHHNNIKFTRKVVWRDPVYMSIIKAATDFEADLVIKSIHQHSALERWFFNTTESQLLYTCPIPLLLARNSDLPSGAKVIAALAPQDCQAEKSQSHNYILETGFAMANQMKRELHACHCFDPSYWEILIEAVREAEIWTDVFPVNTESDSQKVIDLLLEQHNKSFAKTCEGLVPRSDHQHLICGTPENALPQTITSLKAGVLVVGSDYRTGFLGSTAESLLQKVECDVLVVKPEYFESPVD